MDEHASPRPLRKKTRIDKRQLTKMVQSIYLQSRTMQRQLKDDRPDAVLALLVGLYEDLAQLLNGDRSK